MSLVAATYFLAVGFWFLTALYGVLASQAFVQEQFIVPRLFDPLAAFADWHALISMLVLALWTVARAWKSSRAALAGTGAVAIIWTAATALLAVAVPLPARHTTMAAMAITGVGVFVILALAVAELRSSGENHNPPVRDRSRADLVACLLA